jgi:hypothetical protein
MGAVQGCQSRRGAIHNRPIHQLRELRSCLLLFVNGWFWVLTGQVRGGGAQVLSVSLALPREGPASRPEFWVLQGVALLCTLSD